MERRRGSADGASAVSNFLADTIHCATRAVPAMRLCAYSDLAPSQNLQLSTNSVHANWLAAWQTRRKLPVPTASKSAGHRAMHTPSCRYWRFLHFTHLQIDDNSDGETSFSA